MKYVFASYAYVNNFNQPDAWLKRISSYRGILESLAGNNEVISIEHIDFEGQVENNGVQYHFRRFTTNRLRYFPANLNAYIKTLEPDVVFIHSLHFPLQVMQLRFTLGTKVKIIIQNHAEKPFKGLKRLATKFAERYVDAYLFASRDMGMEWIEKRNLTQPEKIYEVMEISSIFKPVNRQEAIAWTGVIGKPVFLWVGRLNDNKDPLNVVRAFLKFAAMTPGARLYMIYHTEELLFEIDTLLNASPNKDAIKLVGHIPHVDLLYWFNSADYIVSGSHYEGSGTAICEAMSCGCVPLVTDIQSFRMITNNGECGVLYEPGNECALLDVFIQTHKMDIEKKRDLSLAYYQQKLSFGAIARLIEEITDGL